MYITPTEVTASNTRDRNHKWTSLLLVQATFIQMLFHTPNYQNYHNAQMHELHSCMPVCESMQLQEPQTWTVLRNLGLTGGRKRRNDSCLYISLSIDFALHELQIAVLVVSCSHLGLGHVSQLTLSWPANIHTFLGFSWICIYI